MTTRICWCVLWCFAGVAFCRACGSDSSASGISIAYPQPMTAERVVFISAVKPCEGRAALYDMAGREVAKIGLRAGAPGPFQWDLLPYNLSSGAYVLVVETLTVRIARKILILR